MYKLKLRDETYNVALKKTHYTFGGLAILAVDEDTCEVIAVITVNLPMKPDKDYKAYIDTNNYPWATGFLVRNNIAEWTGFTQNSGFWTYPLYLFNPEKLEEMEEY